MVRAAPTSAPAAAPPASLPGADATRVVPSLQDKKPPTVPAAAPPAAPSLVRGQLGAAATHPATRPVRPPPAAPPAEPDDVPLHLPQPSGVTLPGYRFLSCVGRSPFGCLWTVQDADGRERLADVLLSLGQVPADVRTRLQNLHHPALADREVFRVPPGCLVIVTDLGRQSLRDLFDECRAEGLQGVPREPLLNCLAAVAEALDEINRSEKLAHLAINPTQLLVEDGRVSLEGFGLAPLLWLPAGRSAAQLNPRYSAPELHAPTASPTADQYSLALIYTEMLTGIYPRSKAHGGKSGVLRRPGAGEAAPASGQHRGPNLAGRHPASSGGGRVDLDFLPAGDRPAVARALHDDPSQRFPSCSTFIQALQAATPPPVVSELHAAVLPPVVPFAQLMGKAPPAAEAAPAAEELAAELIAAAVGPMAVLQADHARYIVHADGAWEYRFPIRLFASLLRPKLEGFRQQWNARSADGDPEAFAFEIRTSEERGGFWRGSRPRPAGLNVELRFQPADAPDANQREAVVRVGLFGDHGRRRETLLPATAPRIFQSLRAYLQGNTEQRTRERWPFTQRIGVYPVLSNLIIGKPLEGWGRDVSLGGVRLLAPEEPRSEFAYLHFHETPKTAPLAVLGRIVRVQSLEDGAYELGFTFVVDAPHETTP